MNSDVIAKGNEAGMSIIPAVKRPYRLEFIKTLGEGTHGKVILASDPVNTQQFAVKMITKNSLNSSKDKFHIQREIEIQSKLRHPHIITVYEVYETESTVTLVMEYANGGELFDFINSQTMSDTSDGPYPGFAGGLNETEARQIFCQLVSAVQYLHKNGIVHRDLKLENILLDSRGNAKIADFGLSTTYGHGHMLKTYCGSPLYASPEIVNARPYAGPEADCWSLGVLLYAMLYGTMPFDGHDFRTLRRQITSGLVQQPALLSGAHELILHILEPSLEQRATLHDIASHPWLQDSTGAAPVTQLSPTDANDNPCSSDVELTGEVCEVGHSASFPRSDSSWGHSSCDNLQSVFPADMPDDDNSLRRSLSTPVCSDWERVNVECCSPERHENVVSGEGSIRLSDSGSVNHSPRLSDDPGFGDGGECQMGVDNSGDGIITVFPASHSCDHSRAGCYAPASTLFLVAAVEEAIGSQLTKLPTGFSADSLELSVGRDSNDDSCDEDDDDACCRSYDLTDIDVVLNEIAGPCISVDPGSNVSSDSLDNVE